MSPHFFTLQELAPSRLVPPHEPRPLFPPQRGGPALPVGKLLCLVAVV